MSLNGNQKAGAKADDRWDKQVEIAYEGANDNRDYTMKNMALAYNDAVLGKNIQERNLIQQTLFQDTTSTRAWDHEAKKVVFDFNSQVDAYNKSETLFGAQVDLNEYARGMADKSAGDVKDERLFGVKSGMLRSDLDRKKGLFAVDAGMTRSDLDRKKGLYTLNSGLTRSDLDRKKGMSALAFQDAQGNLDLTKTESDIGSKRAGLNIGSAKARTDINQQQQSASLQRQQQRAESAFNSEKQLVEIMQTAGQAAAKGQTGRSAEKTVQSIMAAGGRAQAQLADQITRGDSAYNLTMMGLDKSLIYGETEGALAQSTLALQRGNAKLGYGLSQQQTQAGRGHIQSSFGLSQADAQAARGHIQSSFGLSQAEAVAARGHIQSSFGLSQAEAERTKLSIRDAYGRALKKSEFDEYGANLQADAQRMAEPGMAPLPPKPLELPKAILMDPMLPQDLPEVRKGAGSGGVGAAQGAAADTAMLVNAFVSLASAGLGGLMACDMRVKHEVASLEYTEVDDTLSKLAFAVKVLREHS